MAIGKHPLQTPIGAKHLILTGVGASTPIFLEAPLQRQNI